MTAIATRNVMFGERIARVWLWWLFTRRPLRERATFLRGRLLFVLKLLAQAKPDPHQTSCSGLTYSSIRPQTTRTGPSVIHIKHRARTKPPEIRPIPSARTFRVLSAARS